jgi:hypothetical protein
MAHKHREGWRRLKIDAARRNWRTCHRCKIRREAMRRRRRDGKSKETVGLLLLKVGWRVVDRSRKSQCRVALICSGAVKVRTRQRCRMGGEAIGRHGDKGEGKETTVLPLREEMRGARHDCPQVEK